MRAVLPGPSNAVLRRRDVIGGVALLLFLVVALLLLGRAGSAGEEQPYRPDSSGPDGLLALRLWLEKLGYQVATTGREDFALPATADLLFIYPGNERNYTVDEVGQIHSWVTAGHTLALIGPNWSETALDEAFHVAPDNSPAAAGPGRQELPLLPAAPAELGGAASTEYLQLREAPAALPVLRSPAGQALAAVQGVGAGTVWHLSARYPLTNRALSSEDDAHLVLAILRTVPAGGTAVFDTYHLFGSPGRAAETHEIGSLREWAVRTSAGRALLFGTAVVLLYLLLQGVRLGPPLPDDTVLQRREAGEYVAAMAGLQRRAGLRRAVARHHKARLKAELARAYGLDPELSDAELLARLPAVQEASDPGRASIIQALLAGLDADPDEATLVRLVAEMDAVSGNSGVARKH